MSSDDFSRKGENPSKSFTEGGYEEIIVELKQNERESTNRTKEHRKRYDDIP